MVGDSAFRKSTSHGTADQIRKILKYKFFAKTKTINIQQNFVFVPQKWKK